MRKFKLWNHDKTEYIDMSSENCFAKEPKNLGIGYDLTFKETSGGRYVENIKDSNGDISFTLIFGIKLNAYQMFEEFREFVRSNGNQIFILEYDDGISVIYRDVYLKEFGKSEKTEFGVLESELILSPKSAWYEEFTTLTDITTTGLILNAPDNLEGSPTIIEIESSLLTKPRIKIGYNDDDYVHFINTTLRTGEKLVIDAVNQKIYTVLHGLYTVSSYGYHDLTKLSFIFLKKTDNQIYLYAGTGETANVKVTYRRYV